MLPKNEPNKLIFQEIIVRGQKCFLDKYLIDNLETIKCYNVKISSKAGLENLIVFRISDDLNWELV